jgi:hypothetical protein
MGFGGGRGMGRGLRGGRGLGRRWQHRMPLAPQGPVEPPCQADDMTQLRVQMQQVRQTLQAMEDRMEQLQADHPSQD